MESDPIKMLQGQKWNKFTILNNLTSTRIEATSQVFLATQNPKKSSKNIALKIQNTQNSNDRDFGCSSVLLLEMSTLQLCKNHPNIVQLYSIIFWKNQVGFQFKLESCNLQKWIQQHDFDYRLYYFSSMFSSVLSVCIYLRSINHTHFDLKSANILVSLSPSISFKVGDFGLTAPNQYYWLSGKQALCTLWYRAPELLVHKNRKNSDPTPIDLWSLAIIGCEMLIKKVPFRKKTIREMLSVISYWSYEFSTPEVNLEQRYSLEELSIKLKSGLISGNVDVWLLFESYLEKEQIAIIPKYIPKVLHCGLQLFPNDRLNLIQHWEKWSNSPMTIKVNSNNFIQRKIVLQSLVRIAFLAKHFKLNEYVMIFAFDLLSRWANQVIRISRLDEIVCLRIADHLIGPQPVPSIRYLENYPNYNSTQFIIRERKICKKLKFALYPIDYSELWSRFLLVRLQFYHQLANINIDQINDDLFDWLNS